MPPPLTETAVPEPPLLAEAGLGPHSRAPPGVRAFSRIAFVTLTDCLP